MGMTSEKKDTGGVFLPELGIRRSLIEGLTIKTLHFLGEGTTHDLAAQMCISPSIVDGVFQRLRKDQLAQATGMSQAGHRITLTSAGRQRAVELLNVDQYVGPAPMAASARPAADSGWRVSARTANGRSGASSTARTSPPPCWPVAPTTATMRSPVIVSRYRSTPGPDRTLYGI
jgi:hypothetical protein